MLRREKIILACLLIFSLTLSCGDNSAEPHQNRPPNAPTNPSPANGATNQSIDVDLSWDCSDPDGDALTYGVAMAGLPPDTVSSPDLTQTNFDPGPLNYSTLYAWAVIALDEHGDTATSQIWTFTTESGTSNNPPAAPSSPSPSNGATNQPTTVLLSWSCSDPDGDSLTYDVYFGTSTSPPLAGSNRSDTTFVLGTLQEGTTYYWHIVADDGTDQTQGSTWSFSTVSTGIQLIGSYELSAYAWSVSIRGDYAYVGGGLDGLIILDISNPTDPTFVGSYNTPGSARETYFSITYVYIADAQSGLQIIDVTNPAHPLLTGSYNTTYADGVALGGSYTYLADRWDHKLYIISGASPSSPTLTGSYTTGDECRKVRVIGDYAYVANFDSGLLILNISNPSNPTFVGELDLPDQALGVYVLDNYAYVADYYSGLKIIDVSNPASPSLTGTYSTPDATWFVVVEGDYAYLAAGAQGLNIIDVSDPGSPTLAAQYYTAGGTIYVAKYGNYIYLIDGYFFYIVEYIQ